MGKKPNNLFTICAVNDKIPDKKWNQTLMIADNWHWHSSVTFHQLTHTQCLGAEGDNNRYAQIEVS